MDSEITTLDWPFISPNLNVIDNVYSWLVDGMYQGNRQFGNVQDLTDAVMAACDRLDVTKLQNLVHSMPRRLPECMIEKSGAARSAKKVVVV